MAVADFLESSASKSFQPDHLHGGSDQGCRLTSFMIFLKNHNETRAARF